MGYTKYDIKKKMEVDGEVLYIYEAISDNHGRDSLVGTFASLGDPNHHDSETVASRRGKPMTDQIGFELVREARMKLESEE